MTQFENFRNLLKEDRSIRRFDSSRKISTEDLEKLVELTRFCSSGRNLQPLRYKIVNGEDSCNALFPLLAWAGYLTDWPGPVETERPMAYLVQCLDLTLAKDCLCDDGLQLQAITLGARTLGLGCCILKAFSPEKVADALGIDISKMMPRYVLAIGYPVENVVIEDIVGEDYKYYRTEDGTHHVPKRPLSDLIIS